MTFYRRDRALRSKIPKVPRSPYGSRSERYGFYRFERTTFTVNGQGPVVSDNTSRWVVSSTHSRTGVSLPNWRAIIKSGGDATTSFDGTKQHYSAETGYAWSESWNNLGKYQRNLYESSGYPYLVENWGDLSPMWIPADLEDEANNHALRNIHKRIRETRTKMQGGVFLGELRETIRMVKSPFKAIRDKTELYLRNLQFRRKGLVQLPNRRKAKALKDVLSETWLEYRFGVLPLAMDLDDAMSAYLQTVTKQRQIRVSATGRADRITIYPPAGAAFGQVPVIQDKRKLYTTSVRYKVGLSFKTDSEMTPQMWKRQAFGFTLENFVPTVWEIIPWSFLVDYFTNIGDILNAASTDLSNVTYICKTVRKSTEVHLSESVDVAGIKAGAGQLFISAGGSGGKIKQISSTVKRRRLTTLGVPSFSVSLPSSPIQWANMAALATLRAKLTPFK